ncbi:MAG: hypothetical protein AUG49_21160 [Catenulispora sp. 13_1_20CM_3_70_7]|nr:MAG: hypothetical protein AUG49_21160 [Catenulispora sp. 13_1_20CM_3_70_7]
MTETRQNDIHQPLTRVQAAVNAGDLEAVLSLIDEVCAPDLVLHTPVPSSETGPALMKAVWITLMGAFPDLRVDTREVITEGDKTVYRNVVTGTHHGTYMGVPPTGRTVSYDEIFIVRVVDGKIAEVRGVVDTAAQMRQLGLIPAPHTPAGSTAPAAPARAAGSREAKE